jgi:hypothetical protein
MTEESNETGGQAFPLGAKWDEDQGSFELLDATYQGMTMRDYFAGNAMQTLLGDKDESEIWRKSDKGEEEFNKYVSRRAYAIADSMLKQRQKGISTPYTQS